MASNDVLLGYRHMTDVPSSCPCGDCGFYMMLRRVDGLTVEFQSWCGRRLPCEFDSEEELQDFIRSNSGKSE